MTETAVAKEWGMIPSEFRHLSDEDKAYMIAHEEAEAQISAVNAYIADLAVKKAERDANQSNHPRRR